MTALRPNFGRCSDPGADVQLVHSFGFLIGEDGQGLRTILDISTLLRHDSGVMSAGVMRSATAKAVNFIRGLVSNGDLSIGEATMSQRVLADMALDVAGSCALMHRIAQAYDGARYSPENASYARLMTSSAKYWVGKTAPMIANEAMDLIGQGTLSGHNSIERHLRDASSHLVWDDRSNAMALDVARVLAHGSDLFNTVVDDITENLGAAGGRTRDVLHACMTVCHSDMGAVRMLTEQLALAGAASELVKIGAGSIAEAFVETRLGGTWRASYGMLDARFDSARIIELLYPEHR